MRFRAFATDYDGTLARHGVVAGSTVQAVERVRAAGLRTLLVTGREIADLRATFFRFDIFDIIVAENGAVLYYPAAQTSRLLHASPPPQFAVRLRERGVSPLSVGQVIVATFEPNENIVLEVIKEFGLELKIIFNKGAVMVLPVGVNKASGLRAALQELGIAPRETVGIGDAENDHSFFECCGCAVAVSNALESLKARANLVTRASHGAGVVEVADLLLTGELERVAARPRAAAM